MDFDTFFIEEVDVGTPQIPELEQPELEFEQNMPEQLSRKREIKITHPYLGKLAKSKLISTRAARLQKGAPSVIPINRLRSYEPQEIARQELEERVMPIKVIRQFPDGTYEEWDLSEFLWIA